MQLPKALLSQFAKVTRTEKVKKETTVYGTIEEKDGSKYVRLDGSDILTPISTTVEMQAGERVTVMIKNHEAIVTGNITSPAARSITLNELAESTNQNINDLNERTAGSVLVDLIYPVGSVYISVSSADPASLFGHGKWERIKDRFLLSSGDTYTAGSTGGEASHTLTTNEMPKHAHDEQIRVEGYSGWDAYTTDGYGVLFNYGSSNYGIKYQGAGSTYNSATVSAYASTGSTGGSQPHNNMPPYLAVYVWKRIE